MARTLLLTSLALLAFAANSLLCRAALGAHEIDASSFTAVRLCAGALALAPLAWRSRRPAERPSWLSALALFIYALAFSFAYRTLPTGTGALLLFGAVQVTMIGAALLAGERPRLGEWLGLGAAIVGIVWLVWPGVSAPPLAGAALMIAAGVSWGAYTLRGRGAPSAAAATAWSFLRAAPLALIMLALASLAASVAPAVSAPHGSATGLVLAAVSGAVTSGLGYVVWYAALRGHSAMSAAIVQLAVPVLAGLGGVLILGERVSPRLLLATALVVGGIALATATRRRGR